MSELKVQIKDQNEVHLKLGGPWLITSGVKSKEEIKDLIASNSKAKVFHIEGSAISEWDSALLIFVSKCAELCKEANIKCEISGFPEGVQKLLKLAVAIPERQGARRDGIKEGFLESIGKRSLSLYKSFLEMVSFVGELCITLYDFVRGKAHFRWSDFTEVLEECGPNALPIVTLISTLVGLILAFIGAVQLAQFGAQIYVANLVGIAMLREMGAIMAGIILAGRTGAAFAAQLGTMEVNEEIDALKTLGISPMAFLVLPRALALAIMMPLLCLYADLMGILGGAVIGISSMGLSPILYMDQTIEAVTFADFSVGLIKSAVFGVLVAISGCMRGIQCGRSASAVGQAATSAVVTAIVLIVVTDAVFSVVCNIIGV